MAAQVGGVRWDGRNRGPRLYRVGLLAGKDWQPPSSESSIEEIESIFLQSSVAWGDVPLRTN